MCSTPSAPAATTTTQKKEEVAPTQADASVTKSVASSRNKSATLAGRDTRTAPRGLSDAAVSQKKQLLGE